MICDLLKNADTYVGLYPGIDRVLRAAKEITAENFPKEPVVLDGADIFINAPNYETHGTDTAIFEAHQQYIDVFVMVEGTETVYVKNTDALRHITHSYDPAIDALLAEFEDDAIPIRLEPGTFLILFPQDAHAPGCHVGKSGNVKKLIGKVRLV